MYNYIEDKLIKAGVAIFQDNYIEDKLVQLKNYLILQLKGVYDV